MFATSFLKVPTCNFILMLFYFQTTANVAIALFHRLYENRSKIELQLWVQKLFKKLLLKLFISRFELCS